MSKVIKLSYKREFNANFKDGKAVRVTTIKALGKVPEEYLKGYPNCFKNNSALVINKGTDKKIIVKEGDLYEENQLKEIIRIVAVCGDRLRKINLKIKSEWQTSKPTAVKI